MSYHNGSVWPHDNALIAMGLARYGHKAEVLTIFQGLAEAAVYDEFRRLPELFCGFSRRRKRGPTSYPVACSPQAWAAAAPFALVAAATGLELDHAERRRPPRPPRRCPPSSTTSSCATSASPALAARPAPVALRRRRHHRGHPARGQGRADRSSNRLTARPFSLDAGAAMTDRAILFLPRAPLRRRAAAACLALVVHTADAARLHRW